MSVLRLLFLELKHLSHNLDMGNLQKSLSPPSFSTSSSSSLCPHPLPIDSERWLMVEKRTQEILYTIQPAFASEQKRKEVIDYIQSLIQGYFAVEVFPFGSVPLKTYLPDGDIDLMTLSHQSMEEDLAKDVFTLLQCEEQDPEFQVNDVQYIQAQVKVVKCSVKNIAVDISFNRMGGPSALCFLEQVDQLIGRDHLFKRSIILIKAWCFYESRILGAHHGLISTYALQILVLNIINNFHSSLSGPLAVLYKFLDYYSAFDWDNYCVSINGPIPISSFPQMESIIDNNGNELLLSQEFLRNCRDMFAFPMKELENGALEFPIKHLNIVDPLKSSNNLGRSVNKGNFHRIRGALSYGAQRLAEIIALPGEAMGARLEKFFMNTLDRNGKGQRPDADVPVPAFGTGRSEASDLSGDYDKYYSCLLHGQWYHNYALPVPPQLSPPSPSQIKQKSARDVLPQLLRSKQNVFSPRGTDVFLPRPQCHPYASQLQGATSGIDTTRKSRGTGTYIPDMCHNRYKDLLLWMTMSNPDSTHRPLLQSPRMTDQAEESPKTEKSGNGNCLDIPPDQISPETERSENGSCVDLSLDQFPLLPSSKKSVSSEIHQSYQNIAEACQAKDRSSPLGNIQFGSFQSSPSLPGLPSSVVKEQADSGVSTTMDRMPAVLRTEMQKQIGFLESPEKMVRKQQYQLKNDIDFPPL